MDSDDAFDRSMELLHRAGAADRDALDEVLSHYRQRLLGRIRLMMGPDARRIAESQDFLQGLFAEIVRDLPRTNIRSERDFLRWATGIARNNIRDGVRRRRERSLEGFARSDLFAPPEDGREPTPSERFALCERTERIVEALEQLGDDHQRVIELRYFEGLRFAEIGRLMGRSEAAAQMLHSRAVEGLVQIFSTRGGDR